MKYLRDRRKALGGYQPFRNNEFRPCNPPDRKAFEGLYKGTPPGKGQSTTLAWVVLMTQLMKDANVGKLIVPIVPDEGQTFGMPPMYKAFGIYSSLGQLYTPVDKGTLTEYRESTTGQILQEGINEAGSMSSFIAAGTAYSTHGVNTIPFYIFYSMFGFQRVGDLCWAAADARTRGFLMGATAGRTTLNGEGLQHEDGHSHLLAMTIPTCRAYDPAYAYELAVIIEDGINRMFVQNEECFYYLTVYNESYDMPPMPGEEVREGIVRGIYKLKSVALPGAKHEVQLLGSGVILNEVLRAQTILAEKYSVKSTVYSVTSYQQLRRDALEVERLNRLHPDEPAAMSYVELVLGETKGPVIASSDYMRALPESISPFLKDNHGTRLLALGTDGFGRSDTRKRLRRFFEVDAEHVVITALYALAERGELDRNAVKQAIMDFGIDPDSPAPWTV
jgi:pyruvate dehydrogenase E1 component